MKRERIAIIDKAPSKNNYSKHFSFEFDLYHMSSVPITKLLKKDVDLVVDLDEYDLVILVGAEAAKEYAKVTSVTNYAGLLVDDKYVCISNPAMLIFKPEGKPDFQRAIDKIEKYVTGQLGAAKATGDYRGICNETEAVEYFKQVLLEGTEFVALDTETTALYPRDGYVLGLSMTHKPKHGRYILTDVLGDEAMQLLEQIIAKFDIVFHNLKFDYKMLNYHLGLKFDRQRVHDTMIMHYILDENDSHGLKPLALKYTDFGDYDSELDDFKKEYCAKHGLLQDEFTYDLIPFDIISNYAAIDTAVTYELYAKFKPIISKNQKLDWLYKNLMMPGILFLMDMEEVGIPMDIGRLTAANNYLEQEIIEARKEIFEFEAVKNYEADSKSVFNPGSVMQLRKVLFDYAGLSPTGKMTKAGAISTDAEVLNELADQHPLPKAILKVRQLTKIHSSYIVKILPELDRDQRIRTNFNLTFTTSGRLSSSGKFNAQQIPRDSYYVKGAIKAPAGYKIVSQDLTTAEMYYAAVVSGDTELMKVFSTGGDFHSTIAKMVFNLPCEVDLVKKLYGSMRQSAKAISFGILYGSGAAKVSESVTKATGEYYPVEQAREDIKSYFSRFSKLKKWLDSRKDFISANGYTYSFFGRKRRLPNVFSADKGIASHEVRSGINAEIQSLASDMNLLGAIDTANECSAKKLDAKIFMLVHDSVVALVREDQVDTYCEILKRNTQKDRGCSIPLCPIGVDQDIGDDYSFGKFDEKYRVENNNLVVIKE
jgi:DNA polymerase I-like protein with 3'-5' exonuclease and polymerase domains